MCPPYFRHHPHPSAGLLATISVAQKEHTSEEVQMQCKGWGLQ